LLKGPVAYFAAIKKSTETMSREIKLSDEQTLEDFYQIWNKRAAKVEDVTEGQRKLLDQAALKDKAATEEAARAAIAAAQKRAEETRKIGEAELRSQVELAREGTAARLQAEMRLLDFNRETEKIDARAHGASLADLAAIDRTYYNLRIALEKKYETDAAALAAKTAEAEFAAAVKRNQHLLQLNDKMRAQEIAKERADAKAEVAIIDARIASERRYSNQWIAESRKRIRAMLVEAVAADKTEKGREAAMAAYVAADKQLTGEVIANARQRQQAEAGSLASSLESMSATFSGSKELAVAATTVSTYAAAQQAYYNALEIGGPYAQVLAVIAAAAAVAAGLARVAQIKGIGFDDPVSDAASRVGGQRWAVDQVREFSVGAAAGWKEAMTGVSFGAAQQAVPIAPPSVINRQSSFAPVTNTTVNISGFVGAGRVEMLKRLRRELDLVDRTVIRRSRVSGS
jgi:hypothetical protein